MTLALPLDWRLLGFLAALGVTTGVGFGLVPAWRARRVNAADIVAHATAGRVTRRGAVSGPLVVAQVALSLVLVVAAGLFGRTFTALARPRPRLPAGGPAAGLARHRTHAGRAARRRPRPRARRRRAGAGRAGGGGVVDRALGRHLLDGIARRARRPAWPRAPSGRCTSTRSRRAGSRPTAPRSSPGRDFDARDVPGAPVAIVNAAFVRRFFGSQPALGRHVRISTGTPARNWWRSSASSATPPTAICTSGRRRCTGRWRSSRSRSRSRR